MYACTCECRCPRRPEEGIRDGVTDDCEEPDVGAGNSRDFSASTASAVNF